MQNLNLAKEVRGQKLREGQEIGKLVLLAEARLGELFNQLPKVGVGGNGSNQHQKAIIPATRNNCTTEPESEDESEDEEEPPPKLKPKLVVAAEMGFNKNQVAQFQKLADNPEAIQKAIDDAEKNNTIATRTTLKGKLTFANIQKRRLSGGGYCHERIIGDCRNSGGCARGCRSRR